jgi:CBS domain-containing protein
MNSASTAILAHDPPQPGNTAADLMVPNPVSIRDTATILEAVSLFTQRGLSAAPVSDNAGRPVGVLSQTDLLIHEREQFRAPAKAAPSAGPPGQASPESGPDRARVRDIMTPAVFAVPSNYSASQVMDEILRLKVHQLFVVDDSGVLVGVIGVLDVLRRLQGDQAK